MHTRLSEDSNRHSPQRWEGGVSTEGIGIWEPNRSHTRTCMQVHKNLGHSLVPEQSTQQIARTPLGCSTRLRPSHRSVTLGRTRGHYFKAFKLFTWRTISRVAIVLDVECCHGAGLIASRLTHHVVL